MKQTPIQFALNQLRLIAKYSIEDSEITRIMLGYIDEIEEELKK